MGDRFYCPGPWTDAQARLVGDEARHLARVRRVAEGEVVALFDGDGRSARARVESIGKDSVTLTIVETSDDPRRLDGPLVLATAVPKGDRFDWLVEKATEIGVDRLVPLVTARSVVDPRATKLDRLRRLVVEASKQSGRARLMTIEDPTPWTSWLARRGECETAYLAHPSGPPVTDGPKADLVGGLAVAVGPEGGFTDEEAEAAHRAGYRAIGLGPTILRVETAALAACVAALTWTHRERGGDE